MAELKQFIASTTRTLKLLEQDNFRNPAHSTILLSKKRQVEALRLVHPFNAELILLKADINALQSQLDVAIVARYIQHTEDMLQRIEDIRVKISGKDEEKKETKKKRPWWMPSCITGA